MMGEGMHADAAESFDPLRPRLTRVAYRMLGSVADAEDVVQEAFIRWMGADRDVVIEPEAFLRRTVTRLCLDQLKSARRKRETYVGPWLPEPVLEEEADEDVTLPLMLALERLSPLERAAFLLHDVFGIGFEEISATLQREPAACRQLAARARGHVREARQAVDERGADKRRAAFAEPRRQRLVRLQHMIEPDDRLHGGRALGATVGVDGHVRREHRTQGGHVAAARGGEEGFGDFETMLLLHPEAGAGVADVGTGARGELPAGGGLAVERAGDLLEADAEHVVEQEGGAFERGEPFEREQERQGHVLVRVLLEHRLGQPRPDISFAFAAGGLELVEA